MNHSKAMGEELPVPLDWTRPQAGVMTSESTGGHAFFGLNVGALALEQVIHPPTYSKSVKTTQHDASA